MANTARLYRIESIIRRNGHASRRELLAELEVSPATLKRDLEYLRSRLGAPIEYDATVNGYRFVRTSRDPVQELPGLWFSERELYALMTAYRLLSSVDADGVLNRHLQPLRDRVHQMLGSGDAQRADDLMQRVKIATPTQRPVPSSFFERIGQALMSRRRVAMRYLSRGREAWSDREVSPQRLVHYRGTWYLDAWCHRAGALRRFALDAIEWAEITELPANEVSLEEVEAAMDAGYGIYAGGEKRWATLVFSARAAAWVSREQWHPEQRSRWLDDGRYELGLPFVDDTELVMDVLRQGDDVEVTGPPELREKVRQKIRSAAAAYGVAV